MAKRRMRVNPNQRISLRGGRETWKAKPFINVGVSQTAILTLDMGVTYEAVHLVFGGTTMSAAHMSAIRVYINNYPVHNLSGTIRDLKNQIDKYPASSVNSILTIPFTRRGLRDGADLHTCIQTLTAGTPQAPNGISAVRIEVDIDSGAVAPTLVAYVVVRDNNRANARAVMRSELHQEQIPAGVAQEYLLTTKFNADPARAFLSSIIFAQADTEITAFRITANKKDVVNRTAKVNEQEQALWGFRAAQSGYVTYDTSENGYSNPLRVAGVSDLGINITTAAGNYLLSMYVDTLGQISPAT